VGQVNASLAALKNSPVERRTTSPAELDGRPDHGRFNSMPAMTFNERISRAGYIAPANPIKSGSGQINSSQISGDPFHSHSMIPMDTGRLDWANIPGQDGSQATDMESMENRLRNMLRG